MKKIVVLFVGILLAFGSSILVSQQNERNIAQATADRLSKELDFGFSQNYRIVDPKVIFFDVDQQKRDAILYLNAHPVFRFKVRIVNHESAKISIAGNEYVLTGNTDQRIIIDKGVGKIFIKKKERSAAVTKALFSTVTFQKTPAGKIRFLVKNPGKMSVKIHSYRNDKVHADFYMKDIFVFSLDAEHLKVGGRVNNIVWLMKGNLGDELALNTSRKILYFRSGHPRGTWAQVEEIK